MKAPEFEALKESIRRHGQREPILVHQGKVVDGRHRLRACRELGIPPWTVEVEWDEVGSLERLIWDRNATRRHLTESQRALVAVPFLEALRRGGRASTNLSKRDSRAEAARMAGVSQGLMAQALRVSNRGNPGLIEAVRSGELKLDPADTLLALSDDELASVVAGGPEPAKKRAAELRKTRRPRPPSAGDEDRSPSVPQIAGRDDVGRVAMPMGEGGPAGPGADEPPDARDRDEEGAAVMEPDALEPAASWQAAPDRDLPTSGGLQADIASPRPDDPDGRQVALAPVDADLPAVMPDWGDEALAEKPRLDPDGQYTSGEWIKIWKLRRLLGFRCLEDFDKWVRIYGRVRPAIELLCQEVRLNRNDIETIENSGIADHPDASPGSVLGPAASLVPPWRWPLCKRCDGQGYRRDAASGDGPRPEPCERCSGRGYKARYAPKEVATWSSRNRARSRVIGSQERPASGHGADSEAASPRPEGSAPRPR